MCKRSEQSGALRLLNTYIGLAALIALTPASALAQAPPVEDEEAIKAAKVQAAKADSDDDQDREDEASQITVVTTATRGPRAQQETTQGLNLITRQKIDREQPLTPAEALEDQPGIFIQKTGHIGGAPIIRGLMGNQILLMVDGVRLNNVGLFAGPNSFLQTIDIETIERIEVLRGPGAALYGTDALGGVVNVITRKPLPWQQPGESAMIGSAKMTVGGADGRGRLRLDAAAALERVRARIGGTLLNVGSLRGGGDIGVQYPSGWNEMNLDGLLEYRPAKGHMISLGAWQVDQKDIERFDNWLGRSGGRSDRQRRLATLSYRTKRLGPVFSEAQLKLYAQQQESEDTYLTRPEVRRTSYMTVGADLQLDTLVNEYIKLTYGAHYHRDHGEQRTFPEEGSSIQNSPLATWNNAAAFLLADFSFMNRFVITAATRWEYYRLQTEPEASATPEGLDVDALTLDSSYNAPNGSLGFLARATSWLNFVAQVGTGFRAPNVSDTVSSGAFTLGYNVPSPGVGPERVVSAEGGLRVAHERVTASATYYYTWLYDLMDGQPGTFQGKDYIDLNGNGMRDDGEDIYSKQNVGRAHIQGVELAASWNPSEQWTLFGNGSWITGADDTNDGPLDRAFPTKGTLGARWSKPQQLAWLEGSVTGVAPFDASRVPADRISRDSAYKIDPQDSDSPLIGGDGSLPGYWLLNLRAGARLSSWASVQVALNNLLDVEYRAKDSRIDGAGRNGIATLKLEY